MPEPTTILNPLAVVITAVCCLLMLALSRKNALIPVVVLTCYMTMGDRALILGLNFTMIRVLVLFGWIRLIIRGEFHLMRLNRIDKVFLLWAACSVFFYTVQGFADGEVLDHVKWILGVAYNAIGFYFLGRYLLLDIDDIQRLIRYTSVLILPLAAFMIAEKVTRHNVFGIFGGVRTITALRDGVLRCQGPFGHPILAGTFGATLMPLLAANWWQTKGGRLRAMLGVGAAAVICVTAGSSGPVLAFAAGFLALAAWPLRRRLRMIRWGVLAMLVGLQLVMKAPVYFLIERVGVFGGSSGGHRAMLIDEFVKHFGAWWRWGVSREVTATWHAGNMFDIANNYLVQAVNGGIWTMLAFILIIVVCFQGVGRAVKAMNDRPISDQRTA